MAGGMVTANGVPALDIPPTVTTTLPVPAPVGTNTVMLLSDQVEAAAAAIPLNVTELLLCDGRSEHR